MFYLRIKEKIIMPSSHFRLYHLSHRYGRTDCTKQLVTSILGTKTLQKSLACYRNRSHSSLNHYFRPSYIVNSLLIWSSLGYTIHLFWLGHIYPWNSFIEHPRITKNFQRIYFDTKWTFIYWFTTYEELILYIFCWFREKSFTSRMNVYCLVS